MPSKRTTVQRRKTIRKEDQPQFDFTHFSWRDSKQVSRIDAEGKRVVAMLQDSEILLDDEAFEDACAEQDRIFEEIQANLARVVTDVPRAWLVAGAPDEIDWSKVESYDWLQGNKMQALQRALSEASNPESVSGNSARR